MGDSFIERSVERAVKDMLDDRTIRVLEGVSKVAAKQGGGNAIENFQLLGKRALIALGIVIIGGQLVASAVGLVVSRKAEEQRIERVVRRILEEERQKEEATAEA